MNWIYTLWKREYDNGKKVYVSKVTRTGGGSPTEGTLEEIADYFYRNKPRDNSLTFDSNDSITTIPCLFRKKGQFIDIPAEKDEILDFESILDKRFNR